MAGRPCRTEDFLQRSFTSTPSLASHHDARQGHSDSFVMFPVAIDWLNCTQLSWMSPSSLASSRDSVRGEQVLAGGWGGVARGGGG